MARTDTIEGMMEPGLWFHDDVRNDVLSLRLADQRETPTYAEETEEGFLALRREADDRVVGMTIVNGWKRFGQGERPESLADLEARLEPWGRRLAA